MTSKDFIVKDIERIVLNVPFHPRCAHVKEVRVSDWSVVELCKVTTSCGSRWNRGDASALHLGTIGRRTV